MLGLRVLGVFGFWGFLARFSEFRVVMAHRRPDTPRPLRGSIHAPASQHAANTERVADHSQNSQDAPRASVATCRATERVVDRSHNSEDAAQASVTTPLRTPGGLSIGCTKHAATTERAVDSSNCSGTQPALCLKIGLSTCQHRHTPGPVRGSPIAES